MDLRKFAARWAAQFNNQPSGKPGNRLSATLFALAAVVFITTSAPAQTLATRHETNASRQARIQRTITDTYSHRWEIFGGGGYMRFRSGEYTQKNNEVTWNTQANYFLNPRFSIVADARGMFGNAKPIRATGENVQAPNPQINEYAFTGGVGYRFYAVERIALSAQALGGVSLGDFSGGSKGLTYVQTGFWQDSAKPAFVVNFLADVNIFPNLALRFVPTYVGTTFTSPSGGSLQNSFGFNAGVVYRFGRQ
jgi:hypothetical protein